MNYLIELTEEEIKYICTVIPFKEASAYFKKYPKEFTKLRPGFRVKSLNEDTVIRTLYDFRNKNFIATFLIKHIERWIKEIDEALKRALENGLDQEAAYIQVLSRSFFSENIALFFKINGEEKSEDYLKVMSSAVFFEHIYQRTNEKEKDSLKKRVQELVDTCEKLKIQFLDEENKTEKLRKKAVELNEKLTKKEEQFNSEKEEKIQLFEKINKLEQKLKKMQDDEVWKTEEMQQKINNLTSRLKEQTEITEEYEITLSKYTSKISSMEDDINTWKNQVRSREKQLFKYKAERATLLKEKEFDRTKIKELKEALDKALASEKIYEENLSMFSTETEFYHQKNRKLDELKEIEKEGENFPKTYTNNDRKMPLCPEDIDDFDEYFRYNLESIGFDENEDGSQEFVDYVERCVFCGIPVLIKRGPGINLANCLANTLYGVPIAAHLIYSEGTNIGNVNKFLEGTPDRVVCIDGFIGNCNEMEFIPVLEQYRNKIIILTYMYDKTLRFIPDEFLSSVYFISADIFGSLLRIRDIMEDPSEIKEILAVHKNNTKTKFDSRSQKIFYEIACECGLEKDIAYTMADVLKDEDFMNEMLMFTLLPYVVKVLGKNPYNCSKRLQRYAGEGGRCLKKDILMRWFG